MAEQSLGDLTTFEACDLLGVVDLQSFGVPIRTFPFGLDSCAFMVDDDVRVDLGVAEELSDSAFARLNPTVLPGRLALALSPRKPGVCVALLRFEAGLTLHATVITIDRPDDLACAAANKSARVMATRLLSREPIARAHQLPGSLRAVDPCSFITADMAAVLPGLTASRPMSEPTRHRCSVGGAVGPRLELHFEVGGVLLQDPAVTTIAGRPAVVKSEDTACSVATNNSS